MYIYIYICTHYIYIYIYTYVFMYYGSFKDRILSAPGWLGDLVQVLRSFCRLISGGRRLLSCNLLTAIKTSKSSGSCWIPGNRSGGTSGVEFQERGVCIRAIERL